MTDQQHREMVERQAIAAGMPPDAAKYLAEQQGKPPTDKPHSATRTGARTVRPVARAALTVDQRRDRICGLYRAQAVVVDFKRADLPLADVARILARVNGGHVLTAAGHTSVRIAIHAHQHWKKGKAS